MIDFHDASRVLKVVYGCALPFIFNPFFSTREERRRNYRNARRHCEAKLAEARKRRDVWELGVHKDHLVGIDRDRLRP